MKSIQTHYLNFRLCAALAALSAGFLILSMMTPAFASGPLSRHDDGNPDRSASTSGAEGLIAQSPIINQTLVLGDLGLGIAAHDTREGSGYIMYSEESVHTRFAATPPSQYAADHLIAVVFEGGQWTIDRNKSALVPFTPRSSDLLLAEVNFTTDEVVMLIGESSVIEGINAGYTSGNLVITAEQWGGTPNVGEFGVSGTEVVISAPDNETPLLSNVALNKPASQSSTHYSSTYNVDATANLANDGNTDGIFGNGSVSHTLGGEKSWWEVDLEQIYLLDHIEVWNRTDASTSRLSNFHVLISDEPFVSQDLNTTIAQAGVSDFYFSGEAETPSKITLGRTGRYVRVQLSQNNNLTLSEIVINGSSDITPGDTDNTLQNVALGKAVSQSSDHYSSNAALTGYAHLANDGNTDSLFPNGSVSHTLSNAQAWWEIDLGEVHDLVNVEIWNRTDEAMSRLSNFHVLVSEEPFTSQHLNTTINQAGVGNYYFVGQAGTPSTIAINRAGRYLRVQLTSTNSLVLSEVVILATSGNTSDDPGNDETFDLQNVAMGKAVSQSSLSSGGVPERAVDGNTNGNWGSNSVTHTNDEFQPWWEVDLGTSYNLAYVDLSNRTDCCTDRLKNFHVLVSDVPFTSQDLNTTINQSDVLHYHYAGTAGTTTRIPLSDTGRYMRIQLDGTNPLSLAEVVVNGYPDITITEIAAQQALEGYPFLLPVIATDINDKPLSYSATGLPDEFSIDSASGVISGTADEGSADTYEVTVAVSNGIHTLETQFALIVDNGARKNLALGRSVSQSSLSSGGVPERAVDGNTNGSYSSGSVTHTNDEFQPWWEVDLGQVHLLDNVEIWNRTDCCTTRLADFHVLISDEPFSSQDLSETIAQEGVTDIHFPDTPEALTDLNLGRSGRYLRVQLSGTDPLSLAEVIVNGYVTPAGLFIASIADQQGNAGDEISLQVLGNDSEKNAISYSAFGLPPGLTIDVTSGLIHGTLAETSVGSYMVSVSISNGETNVETHFSWNVSQGDVDNVAKGKSVSQSSLSSGGVAERAVDGNTNGNWGASSVTHTNHEFQPWWEVDLGDIYLIENVDIWNRTDCCSSRLADFHVLVSVEPFNSQDLNATIAQAGVSDYHYPDTPGTTTTFELNRRGRYLRVQLSGTNPLSLAEVVVNGVKSLDLKPLSELPIPGPNNLDAFDSNLSSKIDGQHASYSEFVIDEDKLVQLGKALFWDMQVGSDGVQACASCHFASGIDPRAKNQLNPGPDNAFQIGSGVNYTLVADDFPFHEKADRADRHSSVLRDTDDISSSQGVINSVFEGINEGSNIDLFTTPDDPIFNLSTSSAGVVNTRRVEPRNTPTSVNAVFNFLQFWDGRANNNFNGVTPFGNRDKNAKIVRMNGSAEPVQILMPLSSLASQAVGPPLSHFEMSAAGRSWPEIGKKLLADGILPLAGQLVDETDSHLGSLSNQHASSGATGLNTTYADLIRDAFNEKWTGTSSDVSPVITFTEAAGGTQVPSVKSQDGYPSADGEYTLMEANFSFFFGLALQAYQAELVSDDTPFDHFVEGNYEAISSSAKNGLDIFLSECASCHRGPTFSNATVSEIFSGLSSPDEVANHGIIERMPTALELAKATAFFSTGEKPYMPGVDQLDLNFDPKGKSVEVLAAGTNDVYFEGTLSDSSPSCSKHSTSLSLSATSTSGLSGFLGATADGEFQVFDNCSTSFRVTVESAPVGTYDVRVDGVTRGTLEVLPPAVYDQGFYNISVRPTAEDLGIGGTDPFGNPLSFSDMELLSPGREDIRVGLPGGGLGDGFEFNPPVGSLNEKSDAAGAFKTPILRNIALTAPYMHNGGMLTLRQVVEFYNRGGDFADENLSTLDPDIEALYLSESEIDDLVAFMETLTDERVVNQSAPFDHPELLYPEGHSEVDGITLFNVAVAVGANGGVPIRQFLDGSTVTEATASEQIAATSTSNEDDGEQPYEYALEQNYPNPFNPTTSIRFSLTKPLNVTLEIYNVLGQHVKTLVNSELAAGFHTVTWDGTNDAGQTVASGVYLYHIKTPNFAQSKTMTFQK